MSYSKVENKKIRKRDINSENFSFGKSQDSVNSDSSPTVNPIKLLGWANETLHKLKVDRNHLQKTKKKKESNRNLSSHKSKSKNTTVEPSSPIKDKCVEVDSGVSRTENLLRPPENMTHDSKDGCDKTNSIMGLKQRFGKISWSDGREDIIYEHEVIPKKKKKKKKRKKCEHRELIILNANVCVPEKEKKNKKEKKQRSVYISKDTDSAIKKAKFENSSDLILYNDSESVLEKKKKKKEKELSSLDGINPLDGTYITQLKTKNPLDISKDSPTHIRDKCENNELILLNDSESVPRKKKKNKDKELKTSKNTHLVDPSINNKSALDIKRKYKNFDEYVDHSVDSESNLEKRKKYTHYEDIEGTINESSATNKKEKAIQVSDIIDESVSKKERKKKLKESRTYNETEESLEKPKRKKHKEANTLNDSVEGSEKSRDMGKNKLCKDSDTSYDSFEYKRKQKVKCQDGLDENSYVNKKSKRHDSDSGEISTEKHKDEGECSTEHTKRKGRHLEGDNVDLVETYEYIPKKKKKKRKVTEEIDINICVREEKRVKKKKKKKEKDSDSVVSQESREKHDKTENSETSCVSNGCIQQSVKKKHKKKHKDASETDLTDGFEQKETLEQSTVLVEEKHKHEKKTDRNDDVEYQTTFVSPVLKVRKKSTEQTYKFGPSPIFRLLMTDSDDGEHSCKTCQKCRNSCSNPDASFSKRSDNVVNMYDFSDVVVKTEPGIVIKKEIIEEESASVIEGTETANVQTSLTMKESTNCANITSNVNGTDVSVNIDISNVIVKEEPLSPVHDGLPNAHSFESSVTQTEMIVSNEVDMGESREESSTIINANELSYETQLETSFYQNIYDDKLTIKDELVDFNSENMSENVSYSNTGVAENTSTLLESSDLPQTQIISVVDPHLDNVVSTDSNKQTVNDPHLDNVIMNSNKQTNTVARDVKNSADFSFIDEFISINISNGEGNTEAGESNVTGNELVNQQGNRYFPPLNIGFPDNRPLQQRITEEIYILHFTQVPKKFSKASCSKLLKVPVGDIRVNPNYYDYRWCQNYITVKFNNEHSLQRVLKCHVRKVKCSSWFVNTIPVWREGQKARNRIRF